MDLSRLEQDLFPDLAFFYEDPGFGIHQLRPVSLCSYKAMDLVCPDVLNPLAPITPLQETKQIATFLWLHGQPLKDVCLGLWTGSWREIPKAFTLPDLDQINAFREWRTPIVAMIAATDITLRDQGRSKFDKTPRDVIEPRRLARIIGMIAGATGFPRQEIKWEMFIGEAMQYFHVAARRAGHWTVRPGMQIKEADCEDLVQDWMEEEPGSADANVGSGDPNSEP